MILRTSFVFLIARTSSAVIQPDTLVRRSATLVPPASERTRVRRATRSGMTLFSKICEEVAGIDAEPTRRWSRARAPRASLVFNPASFPSRHHARIDSPFDTRR